MSLSVALLAFNYCDPVSLKLSSAQRTAEWEQELEKSLHCDKRETQAVEVQLLTLRLEHWHPETGV